MSGQSCGHAPRTIRSDITLRRRYTMHHNGSVRHDRHYTLEEARAQLPWVEERLAALRDARARLTDAEARQALADGSPTNGGGASRQRSWARRSWNSRTASRPSTARGIVLRDLDSGLIDFPSVREGEEIYLCWIDGESDIGFWHSLDSGYSGAAAL